MKIITYNINGIRAALQKGFAEWLSQEQPDIVALQEIKAELHQFDVGVFQQLGYEVYWFPALKKGYSGTGILTKITPKNVTYGCGIPAYDDEGRVLRVDFVDLSLMSVYMPSGSSGETRQAFKMQFCEDFLEYLKSLLLVHPNLIVAGDYNICHQAIDIHNPKSNAKSSGFLPEERQWLSDFLEVGFTDAFRHLNPSPDHYTWWSYRGNAREKNLGWRIDYQLITNTLLPRLTGSTILPNASHADHCPVVITLD